MFSCSYPYLQGSYAIKLRAKKPSKYFFQLGKSCKSMSLSCEQFWLSDGCEEDGGDFLEFTNFDDDLGESSR